MLNHMVESLVRHDGLGAVFFALSDTSRRSMVSALAENETLTVGELAAPLPMSLAAASKHLRVLERAGLVSRRVEGRRHVCSLERAPLIEAEDWIAHYRKFWNRSLDLLEARLNEEDDL